MRAGGQQCQPQDSYQCHSGQDNETTGLKGPGLKLLLQNTIWPLVSVKIPEEIFAVAETSDNEDRDENS